MFETWDIRSVIGFAGFIVVAGLVRLMQQYKKYAGDNNV